MTVRYYSSLDTGAPALPSVSGQRLIDNLKLVLLACLVNGYGSKAGAGWTIGHEHADGFSLFNGDGYINFVHKSTASVVIYLMESITDGSTAFAGGDNRRSGQWFDGQATTQRQYLYLNNFSGTVANKQWCVVADDKTAIINCCCGGSITAVDGTNETGAALYFGAYLPPLGGHGFCSLGGHQGDGNYAYLYSRNSGVACGTSLRNPFDGTVAQGVTPIYATAVLRETDNVSGISKPRVTLAALRPVRAALLGRGAGVSGSTLANSDANCGLLRGVVSDPALTDVYLSKVLPLLGVSAPTYQDRIRPITLPNGKQWVPIYPHIGDLGAFVSLDPADW